MIYSRVVQCLLITAFFAIFVVNSVLNCTIGSLDPAAPDCLSATGDGLIQSKPQMRLKVSMSCDSQLKQTRNVHCGSKNRILPRAASFEYDKRLKLCCKPLQLQILYITFPPSAERAKDQRALRSNNTGHFWPSFFSGLRRHKIVYSVH